jgi:hypothetical protein
MREAPTKLMPCLRMFASFLSGSHSNSVSLVRATGRAKDQGDAEALVESSGNVP